MKLPVFSVLDVKANSFMAPVLSSNEETIKRSFFENIINGDDRIMKFSPSDFQLYEIGEFDTEKGLLIPRVPVYMIAKGSEVLGHARIEEE